jgi:hypothetical protein
MRAARGAESATEPAPASAPSEPASATQAAPAKSSSATAATAPQRANESTDAYEERLAKAVQSLVEKDRRAYESEQRAKVLEQQLADTRKRDEERGKDPFYRAVAEGKTYEEVTRDLVEGKLTPPTREQVALTEQEKRVQALEDKLRSYEEREQKTQHEQRYQRDVQSVSERLKSAAEKHPFVSALEWAPGAVVQRHYQASERGETVDLDGVLSHLEQAAAKDVRSILSSDHALASLLKDPDIKTRLAKALGVAEQNQPARQVAPRAEARGNGPSVIPPSLATEPGARVKPALRSADERKVRAAAALRAQRAGQV